MARGEVCVTVQKQKKRGKYTWRRVKEIAGLLAYGEDGTN
jgi:hypothetical protein